MHWCGFSPLCTIMWVFRLDASLNDFTHCVHWCGFSPLCTSMCVFRLHARLNDFTHCVHWCGLSLLCTIVWVLRLDAKLNDFVQTSQTVLTISLRWDYQPQAQLIRHERVLPPQTLSFSFLSISLSPVENKSCLTFLNFLKKKCLVCLPKTTSHSTDYKSHEKT